MSDEQRWNQLLYRIANVIEPVLAQPLVLAEPFHERSARMAADQLAQFKANQILQIIRAEGSALLPTPGGPPRPPSTPA